MVSDTHDNAVPKRTCLTLHSLLRPVITLILSFNPDTVVLTLLILLLPEADCEGVQELFTYIDKFFFVIFF